MAIPPDLAAMLQGGANGPPGVDVPANASITSRDEGSDLDHVRTAIHALQACAEGNHDDQELAAVHKCIVALQNILAGHGEGQGRRDRVDPDVASRQACEQGVGLLSALSDTSKLEAAVQRMSATAMTDDGYRAQLVSLADSHEGIYRSAIDLLYKAERESLGEQAAQARVAGDEQLLADVRKRERKRKARAELEHAGTLAEAAEQAEAAARALREHTKAKVVHMAVKDEDLRQRLLKLANKRKGIYAEALAELDER